MGRGEEEEEEERRRSGSESFRTDISSCFLSMVSPLCAKVVRSGRETSPCSSSSAFPWSSTTSCAVVVVWGAAGAVGFSGVVSSTSTSVGEERLVVLRFLPSPPVLGRSHDLIAASLPPLPLRFRHAAANCPVPRFSRRASYNDEPVLDFRTLHLPFSSPLKHSFCERSNSSPLLLFFFFFGWGMGMRGMILLLLRMTTTTTTTMTRTTLIPTTTTTTTTSTSTTTTATFCHRLGVPYEECDRAFLWHRRWKCGFFSFPFFILPGEGGEARARSGGRAFRGKRKWIGQ